MNDRDVQVTAAAVSRALRATAEQHRADAVAAEEAALGHKQDAQAAREAADALAAAARHLDLSGTLMLLTIEFPGQQGPGPVQPLYDSEGELIDEGPADPDDDPAIISVPIEP